MRSRWRHGETLDIAAEMMRLTLAVVGRTLFGKDVEEDAEHVGAALTDVIATFGVMLTPGADLWRHLPLPVMRRAKRAQHFLNEWISRIVADRRANPGDRGDLLSMMLSAEADNARMTDKQVRDHSLTFLLAGHETTATALAWTWYLLDQNPEADAKMRAEIGDVLGGRLPAYEDVAKLAYTGRVFAEALRLYPPAWAIGRKSRNSMRLFNYLMPGGSICILSPYVTHRHPRLWPDPERFDPERFQTEAIALRPRFAYFPFGGGVRTCIGERFAMMEGVLLLASIAQRWRLRLADPQSVAIEPLITLRPRGGIKMRVGSN
jgi:cytochrome P450